MYIVCNGPFPSSAFAAQRDLKQQQQQIVCNDEMNFSINETKFLISQYSRYPRILVIKKIMPRTLFCLSSFPYSDTTLTP